ncbi:MAG: DNA recombination protein RecF [Bacteroidetes bacterium CG2_30_33_31]|nr:MAG: DNA recombination protein RecF [Bacteroidetes bacterium CG2_30_33_31]
MQINKLSLNYFKNYLEEEFEFSKKVNIFTGNNGAGKTNVLDAIYYLSFTKSYFNSIDNQNINHGSKYFMINGTYNNSLDTVDTVNCAVQQNERKRFRLNKKEYSRMADHIGAFPLVIISPMDINMIFGGSEDRRKYIDSVISQFDKTYLDILLSYNKVLLQRNAFLKILSENKNTEISQLDIWDEKFAFLGNEIYAKRKQFLIDFIPMIRNYYGFISLENEKAGIEYLSHLSEGDFLSLLKENRNKDIMMRYSNVGIHRDDLIFTLDNFTLKKYGSQGQQKSFLVALKLSQFEYTKLKKGFKPLLLLDDIFDKLDFIRIQQMMKLVSRNEFGQIFITDTNRSRIEKVFEGIDVEIKIFEIDNAKIINV